MLPRRVVILGAALATGIILTGSAGSGTTARQAAAVADVFPNDPVVMAAGDIACQPGSAVTATACRQQYTSDRLVAEPELTAVLPLGDTQYEDGLYSEFLGAGAYDATWGRKKSITRPAPGNHEYHDPGASGYFQYFGEAAGAADKGYYSFDLGSWHLIALNSEIATQAVSAQVQWLRADLAGTTKECILAYWHRPRFSSGVHGGTTDVSALWQALYDARADIVLNGHDHDYERFALQNPSGQADAQGIREFVVGTGGASQRSFSGSVQPNSQVRGSGTFGVLKLTLHASSYDWEFVPEAGRTFTDSGTTTCHDAWTIEQVQPPATAPPSGGGSSGGGGGGGGAPRPADVGLQAVPAPSPPVGQSPVAVAPSTASPAPLTPPKLAPRLRALTHSPLRATRSGVVTFTVRFSVSEAARLAASLTPLRSTRRLGIREGSSLAGTRLSASRTSVTAATGRAGSYVLRARVSAALLVKGLTYAVHISATDVTGRRATLVVHVQGCVRSGASAPTRAGGGQTEGRMAAGARSARSRDCTNGWSS